MKYLISKELFEEVIDGCKFVKLYQEDYSRPDRINYTVNSHIIDGAYSDEDISINDFYFKCKEWAFKQGYRLDSSSIPKGDFASSYCIIREWTQPIDRYVKVINSSTEQQAVFDACQWILENKDK